MIFEDRLVSYIMFTLTLECKCTFFTVLNDYINIIVTLDYLRLIHHTWIS